MTKNIEREKARQMRRELGLPINDIAKQIGVSLSSVSTWVRDIELSPEQEAYLNHSNARFRAYRAGGRTNRLKFRDLRRQYQEEGRIKAREGHMLHSQGCMLYWAEGSKARQELIFTNSDVEMMIFFIKFLRQALCVPEEKIIFRVQCYLGNGLSLEEIEGHWLNQLQMTQSQKRKPTVNNQPVSSQQKGRKLFYGVGHLRVSSTVI